MKTALNFVTLKVSGITRYSHTCYLALIDPQWKIGRVPLGISSFGFHHWTELFKDLCSANK